MIVSIHQPSYFPWLGWLHKVMQSDTFVLMDNVQLSDSAYQHRNIFLTNTGTEKFLSVGIKKKGYKDVFLKNIELRMDFNWQEEHLRFLNANYSKHPFYNEVMEHIAPVFNKSYKILGEVLSDVVSITLDMFEVKTKVINQSEMNYNTAAKKGDLVLALIEACGGKTYLSGHGAKDYMADDVFAEKGIKLVYQQFTHPHYTQLNTGNDPVKFIPGIASLDLLFNVGIEESRKILHGV